MVNQDDTPTPRQSRPWQFNADLAREMSRRLRERELVLSNPAPGVLRDVHRAARLRHLRMVAEDFVGAFGRWVIDSVPIEQRAREHAAFHMFIPLANAELAE